MADATPFGPHVESLDSIGADDRAPSLTREDSYKLSEKSRSTTRERLAVAIATKAEVCAAISVFDILSIGVGPSSSHTVGPMRIGQRFAKELQKLGPLQAVARLEVTLHGSLALTGDGHMTPQAVLMGLEGELPFSVDAAAIPRRVREIKSQRVLTLAGQHPVPFQYSKCLRFVPEALPEHPNGLRLCAWDTGGARVLEQVYFSTGGGFFTDRAGLRADNALAHKHLRPAMPFPFHTAAHLLRLCADAGCSIADAAEQNERHFLTLKDRHWPPSTDAGIRAVWATMRGTLLAGVRARDPMLPDLNLPRRAPRLVQSLGKKLYGDSPPEIQGGEWWMYAHTFPLNHDPALAMQLTSAFAIATNEENACGGRVVTAPTNGSCGIVPAVLQHYLTFHHHATPREDGEEGEFAAVKTFLFTAGVIGMLFKGGASISGAEVGCQGEVGVAASMAAAGLCAVLGGDPVKVATAAEMAMQHMLGLTCDPVQGLVQIPCIERNSFGTVHAIHAAHLALEEGWGVGGWTRPVSLDAVIRTMLQTGRDMSANYKETSLAGLALNVTAC